jgi:hypothetical protein
VRECKLAVVVESETFVIQISLSDETKVGAHAGSQDEARALKMGKNASALKIECDNEIWLRRPSPDCQ